MVDLEGLKSDVDKLDIEKLKDIPSGLSNLKSKIDKLDVNKLVSVPVNLSNLSDVVKMMSLKKVFIYIMLRSKILKINNLIILT